MTRDLFGCEVSDGDEGEVYTKKIVTPIYMPRNKKPYILELFDNSKTIRLINEIKNSNISKEEERFLIEAAQRHTVFNYSKIADYYAQSPKETQYLMERSALIIIDFDKAYENGYIKLAGEVAESYLDNYGE